MGITYYDKIGYELDPLQLDENFQTLDQRLYFLENGQVNGVEGIASVEQDGNTVKFIGSQGSVFGPIDLPTGLNFKGDWRIGEYYKKGDVVLQGGSSYVTVRPHTAGKSFFGDLELERFMPLAYQGAKGKDGIIGKDGSKWFIEYGHPNTAAPLEFRDQLDIYLDATDGTIYTRAQGEWIATFSLVGATHALAVAFNNEGTLIKSENLQGAVSELDSRLKVIEEIDHDNIDGGYFS